MFAGNDESGSGTIAQGVELGLGFRFKQKKAIVQQPVAQLPHEGNAGVGEPGISCNYSRVRIPLTLLDIMDSMV